MKTTIAFISTFIFSVLTLISPMKADSITNQQNPNEIAKKLKIYQFDIKEEIAPPVWRTTKKAFEKALEMNADLILIHMNTYGGMVDAADSIRTKILNSKIPVYVFIDNNAASAGALISIACDSIYMISGASIGAATVVNQSGEVVPDKYQSYMRSMMRSTAEASGRDPEIAQAMVDPSIYIAGISDSGKVLTFTTSEAIRHNFCNGKAETIEEVLQLAGIENYEITSHHLNSLDKIINILIHPAVSGILIMLIIGGLYFELQTPGIGFPLAASVVAALLYFAPLYLEGLATNWEIILFVVGVILLLVEIFAIPGFGVTGILGLLFIISGLTFAMVENIEAEPFNVDIIAFSKAFFMVVIAIAISLIGSLYLSKKLFTTHAFGHLALDTVQDKEMGFTTATQDYISMIGSKGKAHSILRPVGKVMIGDEVFDATAIDSFIDEGEAIEVVKYRTGQLFVKKA